MDVNTLIKRLEEDLVILDKNGGYYDYKSMKAYEAGDKDQEAYWEDRANEAWKMSKNIRNALLIIKRVES